jgi:hypothetical protein
MRLLPVHASHWHAGAHAAAIRALSLKGLWASTATAQKQRRARCGAAPPADSRVPKYSSMSFTLPTPHAAAAAVEGY